jgi:talin
MVFEFYIQPISSNPDCIKLSTLSNDSLSPPAPQDFGDYSESFYSVQTTEGETISQLIAGYIDIIMQKKRPIHGEVPDDEDEPVIVELEVDPQR